MHNKVMSNKKNTFKSEELKLHYTVNYTTLSNTILNPRSPLPNATHLTRCFAVSLFDTGINSFHDIFSTEWPAVAVGRP